MDAGGIVLLGFLVWACLWGGLGIWVANQKGHGDGIGFTLGAVFGPIGVIVIAILPSPPPKSEAAPVVAYQFKPRKMLGEVPESRGLRRVD